MPIIGLNGRQYDALTGKRIDAVKHPEHRTRTELSRARAANTPRVEHHFGTPEHGDGNPIRRMIQEHSRRKGIAWQRSHEGRKWLLEREHEAHEWDQEREAKVAEQQRQESVRPLVEHAERQVQQVFDSGEFSVEDVEQAEAAITAARAGDRETYVEWEQAHHSKQLDKLATEAAGADSTAREAVARRDAILKSGINYRPEPIPVIRQPEAPAVPVDRTKRAITRKVPVSGGGYREVTEIVDAE